MNRIAASIATIGRTTSWLLALSLPLALGAQNGSPPQGAGQPPGISRAVPNTIDFSVALIPPAPAAMPVIQLSPQAAPQSFVTDTLTKQGKNTSAIGQLSTLPNVGSQRLPDSYMGLVERSHLAAYWDRDSGDAEIFPILGDQKPASATTASSAKVQVASPTDVARRIFSRTDILPKDATQFTFGDPIPIMAATAVQSAGGSQVTGSDGWVQLTYLPIHRTVAGYPVYGPGSRAMVAVGNDGSIQGFLRHWKFGTPGGTIAESRTPSQIQAEFIKQLTPLTQDATVSVLSVKLAYYDNHQDSIQPVYMATVQVHHLPHAVNGVVGATVPSDDNYVAVYLPVGGGMLAPAPVVTSPGTTTPYRGMPTIGRYIVRDDSPDWAANAKEFWNGLNGFSQDTPVWMAGITYTSGSVASYEGAEYECIQSHTAQIGWEPPNMPALWRIAGPIEPVPEIGVYGTTAIDAQDYWAYPNFFNTSDAITYVNSVNVALTEVHGDWWYFTTYQNWGDGVDITQIPASRGYGGFNQGNLAYWFIHSCEVVPGWPDGGCPYDSRPWWTPWFNMFQGMHTVVGYRTVMYIDDDVGGPFGTNLRAGAPVISAWFNALLSAPLYQGNPTMWSHCGMAPLGRPSAVTVCGHQDDTIFNVSALPPATCLLSLSQPN